MKAAPRARSLFGLWLRGFGKGAPGVVILEQGTGDWDECEQKWIRQLRADGCELLNIDEGGVDVARYRPPAKINLEEAQRMLDAGESVLTIALTFQVATESVYQHIREGRLTRPATSTRGANGGGSKRRAGRVAKRSDGSRRSR